MHSLLLAFLLSQTTPQMSLPLVAPGQATMSQFETDYNNSMALIDAHQHTAGQGVLIPVGGLSIQTPLPFNGQPATGMDYLGLVDAGAGPSVTLTLWNDGINWWVEDGNGNKIQLTKNGGINVVVGDGGSYAFTSITSNSAVIDGWTIASGCLTGANGASYCFDSAGGLQMTSVDAGQINMTDAFLDGFEMSQGAVEMSAFGGGLLQCSNNTNNPAGCFFSGNYPVSFSGAGYTTNLQANPSGTGLLASMSDGGAFTVDVGKGAGTSFQVLYDGGTNAFRVNRLGTTVAGDLVAAEAIVLTPGSAGAGVVTISPSGSVDPNIGIAINPKGDGGVILAGHIDAAAVAVTLDAGTNIPGIGIPCTGTAVETLSVNANDTAGSLSMITARDGGTVSACSDENIIAVINFGNVYDATTDFSVFVQETDNIATPLPIYVNHVPGGFAILVRGTPTPSSSTTYKWDWFTVGQGAGAH